MQQGTQEFDFWYAVRHTRLVRMPSRALETFGETRMTYYHVAELPDDPGKVRVREGRLQAHKPTLIMPEAYMQDCMEGFGEQARQYLDFLKQHEKSIRILQYGFHLSQESFSEQIITDCVDAVIGRVMAEVQTRNDPFSAVILGVDKPWDVSLVHCFLEYARASAPFNVHQFDIARSREEQGLLPIAVEQEVEQAFKKAEANPQLVQQLGVFLQKRGLFERYQDRFFKLLRRG